MTARIKRLAESVVSRDVYPPVTKVSYSPESMFLPECQTIAVKLGEYLRGQEAVITDDEMLIGKMHFDDSVISEYYSGRGHTHMAELNKYYYLKVQDRLCYAEWIHSGADLEFVIKNGFKGYYKKIEEARLVWAGNKEKLEFLEGLRLTADSLLSWSGKCAQVCFDASQDARWGVAVSNELVCALGGLDKDMTGVTPDTVVDRKQQLLTLSRICKRVPLYPATTFYEGIQASYFVFMFLPDSPGRLDQFLYPLYKKDIEEGRITRDFSKELIQEYLIMVFGHQGYLNMRSSDNHFCVGGYTPEGRDGFNELSELILESYLELPIWRPTISFRYTKFTSAETMRMMTRINRKNMNVVFVNDEPRIKSLTNMDIPFEDAVQYTTVGCNEINMQGKGVTNAGLNSNIGRSMALMFAEHSEECLTAREFEDFWQTYVKYLHHDLDETMDYIDKFNAKRAKDISMIASLLNDGCIDKAERITNGGGKYNLAATTVDGLICVADSLSIIKQFVYDEGRIAMETLVNALANNWSGCEDLRAEILREGRFYGNDDDGPDLILKRVVDEIYDHTKDRLNSFGGHFQFGTYVGYNPSNTYFAALLPATPDGRYDGETFGIGMNQLDNKDHTSLTALMRSAAKVDYSHFGGPLVLNLKIDQRLADSEEKLDKLAALYKTYFDLGGIQFQPTYVTTEELLKAQRQPGEYKNLRVRVSGFSGNFVLLGKEIQEEVIRRTEYAN
jgi:formate C-acetyltransferase